MADLDDLRSDLDAARVELLGALKGVSAAEFERWFLRDSLWRLGLVEDWHRRVISEAEAGRAISEFHARPAPAIANGLPYLLEWIGQVRRPTLSLLVRLDTDRLDEEFALPDGSLASATALIRQVAVDDRAEAARIRELRQCATEEAR